MLTKKENLGLFDHSYNKGGKKGKGQRTNKQDEDQTRPATHSPKRDKGHRGTTDTEGQRTLTNPTQSATHSSPLYKSWPPLP